MALIRLKVVDNDNDDDDDGFIKLIREVRSSKAAILITLQSKF